MPAISYLLGIAGNAVTNTALQIVIITVAGRLFFGTGWPRDYGELVVFVCGGVVCFASLGVAFSHAIPNFDSAPAYVNAVFLPVIFVSGVFFDAARAPSFIRGIAQALPLIHLIDGLSGAMVKGTSLGANLGALGVIVAWAALGLFFAVRGFSWEQRRT
jgi:ABC-2 type transport system permease protein